MTVTIQPNHTKVGNPTWHHSAERRTDWGSTIPATSRLDVEERDGGFYSLTLPDHVWREINEHLTEHFAQAAAEVDEARAHERDEAEIARLEAGQVPA